ncbi:MAG TPA: hypothetical protein VK454_07370 [Myxococcaceae bacterium]|nr:hypothetical protein [Myxococcaceae bacterium]
MFIGHYGVSLALKRADPRLSLGGLFVAVQVLDLLFFSFVLLGIEKMRIVPGFTEYNSYDLYYMPYSHSLVGALVWSALALGGVLLFRRAPFAGAALVGLAVFSHFLLDVPMHTPDMPLLGEDSPKLGFGLWNHRFWALAAELVVLGGGLLLYLRASRPRTPGGRRVTLAAAIILVALCVATPFLPPPSGVTSGAVQALFAYVLLAALAVWLDRAREASGPAPGS